MSLKLQPNTEAALWLSLDTDPVPLKMRALNRMTGAPRPLIAPVRAFLAVPELYEKLWFCCAVSGSSHEIKINSSAPMIVNRYFKKK